MNKGDFAYHKGIVCKIVHVWSNGQWYDLEIGDQTETVITKEFLSVHRDEVKPASFFSTIKDDDKLLITRNFFIIRDGFPVSPGHLLIISNTLRLDYFELTQMELIELPEVIIAAKAIIDNDCEINNKPDGYNIGMNCKEAAGQSVMHFHCHVIPRFIGDMDNPKGGVRHCITNKGYY